MMVPVVVVSQIAGRLMSRTGRDKIFPVIVVFTGVGSGLTQRALRRSRFRRP